MRHEKYPLIPEQPDAPNLVTDLPGPTANKKFLVGTAALLVASAFTLRRSGARESG